VSIETLVTSFVLGVGAASSPCLLPLYPGFLAYLAGGASGGRRTPPFLLALLVVTGVLTTVVVLALVVSALAVSLSTVLAALVPVTAIVLTVLGIVMLAGRNPFARLASVRVPVVRHPLGQAFVYGLLMGPVAVPCSGPFLVALLGISIGITDGGARLLSFIVFGIGFCLPLLVLAAIGTVRGQALARWLVVRQGIVLRVSGALLILAALAEPLRSLVEG
jgi:cytochrome c-type biogenesis protein